MNKPLSEMSLKDLAAMVRWFENLATLYERNQMPDAARANRFNADVYRAEMERRADTAE
jgi:hypothetical protein